MIGVTMRNEQERTINIYIKTEGGILNMATPEYDYFNKILFRI